MTGFAGPTGDGGAKASSLLGTVTGDLKGDIKGAQSAVETAMRSWHAPRAAAFKQGVFGVQTQLALVTDAVHQVATAADAFTRAWKQCDHEIAGYRAKADGLHKQLDDAKDDPIKAQSLRNQIHDLEGQADDARKALTKLGQQLAASVDDQTDKLVPKGSTLTADQIRSQVDAATGVTAHAPVTAKAAWDLLDKAQAQGKKVLDLVEDNKEGEKVGGPVTSLPTDPAILKAILDAARFDGVAPQHYAGLLHQYWTAQAAAKAGIDLNAWDPSKGTAGNRSVISAVYTYYGKLFLHDPSKLQWAGMANMIGPSFAGGFLDLHMFKQIAGNVLGPAEKLPDWAKGALPSPLKELDLVGNLSADELGWYEQKFLAMQKHIFFDQGSMHEAYVEGGISAVREMREAGLIDDRAMGAWNDIDSGIPDQIQRGNTNLLYREQNQVINKAYDQMRDHDGPVGEAMTYLMTVIGSASIPGTKTPGEYKPWGFEIGESTSTLGVGQHAKVKVKTPLPDFNISDKDARWDYVTHDTLPAYQKLLHDDPERAKQIIASNVDDRIDDQRLLNRWPKVAGDFLTDWDIDVDAGVDVNVGPIHIGFGF